MLDKFILAKREEIAYLKSIEMEGKFPEKYKNKKIKLSNVLKEKRGIIAEYKRGSPSMGIINKNLSLEDAVYGYITHGAAGVSIITEKKFFYGDMSFLNKLSRISVPILRKDFIFHPIQIKYTSTTPASSILLIVKIFREKYHDLVKLIDYTYLLDMEPVVEVNNYEELEIATKSGAKIILVNNRDLDTLKVDIETSKKLIKHKKNQEIWIAASGITSPHEVVELFDMGYNACLIGTHFMKQKDPFPTLGKFVKTLKESLEC